MACSYLRTTAKLHVCGVMRALLFFSYIYLGATSNSAIFVTLGSSQGQFDPLTLCGAMMNSFITSFARPSDDSGSTVDVSVDLSPYCYQDVVSLSVPVPTDKIQRFGATIFNSTIPGPAYSCDLVRFAFWMAPGYNLIIDYRNWHTNGTLNPPMPVACPIANKPVIAKEDDNPVLLKAYNPLWYTCSQGGETVSPLLAKILPRIDVSMSIYPVPIVISSSTGAAVASGNIKTCQLVPTPALLKLALGLSLGILGLVVCLSCWFWSRCPVYKLRQARSRLPPTRLLDEQL